MTDTKKWKNGDIITAEWLNEVDEHATLAAGIKEEIDTNLQDLNTNLTLLKQAIATNTIKDDQSRSKLAGDIATMKQSIDILIAKDLENGRKDQQTKPISNDSPNIDAPTEHVLVNTSQPLTTNGTIKARKVELGSFHLNGGSVTVEATEDVNIGVVTAIGTVSETPESGASLHIKSGGHVRIDRALIQSENVSVIRIGALDGKSPKTITLDGLDYSKKVGDSAIIVENIANDGVIIISNSVFVNAHNIIKVFNNAVRNRFTIQLVNCTVYNKNTEEKPELAGLITLCDKDADTVDKFYNRHVFRRTTAKIELINVTVGGKKISQVPVETIMASGTADQLISAQTNTGTVVPYKGGADNWPTVIFG